MPFPINLLRGERVRLAAMTEADIEVAASWYQDAEFLQLWDSRPAVPRTVDSLKEEIREAQKSLRDFVFAIRLLESDAPIGYLELDGIEWIHQVGGLGIGIGQSAYRGQGYGSEACRLGLRLAFEELNLHRISATIFSYNTASIRMFQKLGFQQEGVFREFLHRGGRRHDMLLFGMLRPEWEGQHRTWP